MPPAASPSSCTASTSRRSSTTATASVRRGSVNSPDSDPPPATQRAWASGRMLTNDQRVRKRERDRKAQASRKNANSQRFADLQRALELKDFALEEKQRENALLQEQNDRLRQRNHDQSCARHCRLCDQSTTSACPAGYMHDPSMTSRKIDLIFHSSPCSYIVRPTDIPDPDLDADSGPNVLPLPAPGAIGSDNVVATCPPVAHVPLTHTFADVKKRPPGIESRSCCVSKSAGLGVPKRLFEFNYGVLENCSVERDGNALTNLDKEGGSISSLISWAFGHMFQVPDSSICVDDVKNQDMLLRAVIYGWDTVPVTECPLWGLLRVYDDHILHFAGQVNRLAYLRQIHCVMLFYRVHKMPSRVPEWCRPTPTQYRHNHDITVSYFAWPAVRNRFTEARMPLSNGLWVDAVQNFVFEWPDARRPESIYLVNPLTGRLQYTGQFLNAMYDLRRWTFGEDMWKHYPYLFRDIVPPDNVPKQIDYRSAKSESDDSARWRLTSLRAVPPILESSSG